MNNNNTKHKDSPLGKIPSDWEINSFGSVCEKLLDGTHFSPQSKDGPYKYITSKNIRNDGLDLNNVNYVSEKEHREIYKRCPVKFNDVLLTKDGAATGACCKNTLTEEFSLLSSVAVLRVNGEKMNNEFLIHFIKSPIGQKIIQDEISGQAITRITLEKIKSFRIITPSLSEQKAIAHVLGLMDSAINTNNQLIVKKELQKKWLMQNLLTGKKRLKGFRGIWKKYRLHRLADIKKGVQLNKIELEKESAYPAINGGIGPSGYTNEWNTEANTITISEGGNSCGFVNIISTRFWSGGHCYSLLKMTDLVVKNFLYQILKFNEVQIMKLRVGSGLPNIQMKAISNFELQVPPPEEQTAIAQVLKAADKEIQLLKTITEKLREQKKGLMQVLLTGKKRLTVT